MGLNIKNAETERLIRELAEELHVSLTAAVQDAVAARLLALRRERGEPDVDWDKVTEIAAEMRRLMGEAYLGQDFDALLYDEKGLPR